MKKEQAYQVLVDAINLATTKGAFNLQDVSTILGALQVLKPEGFAPAKQEGDEN
jgi:hypothetical protein